jgi:hypothetical protein
LLTQGDDLRSFSDSIPDDLGQVTRSLQGSVALPRMQQKLINH